MTVAIIILLTVMFYLLASGLQSFALTGRITGSTLLVKSSAAAGLVLHAELLYRWIDVTSGQNLSTPNIISMIFWLATLLVLLASYRKAAENLFVFILPLNIVSIVLVLVFPSVDLVNTDGNWHELIHILLSLLTFAVVCIVALQAILTALQNKLLHSHRSTGIVQFLPPLETMESLLFQWVILCLVLLSLVLISSFYTFDNLFAPPYLERSVLAMAAWAIFAVLVIGRLYFGWRGRLAIRLTVGGVLLLSLTYFVGHMLTKILI